MMREPSDWVSELQQCASDPEKIRQAVANIQADAIHAGYEQAMHIATGIVTRSRMLTDQKLARLKTG